MTWKRRKLQQVRSESMMPASRELGEQALARREPQSQTVLQVGDFFRAFDQAGDELRATLVHLARGERAGDRSLLGFGHVRSRGGAGGRGGEEGKEKWEATDHSGMIAP
jgi:hypothetical protein